MVEATWKRIFIKCDKEYKNSHTFESGDTISLQRKFDNFNRRHTQPVNAIVIDSAIIPKGAEILCHHNSTHPTYELPDYKGLDGEYLSGNEKYYSIPETECYAWRIGDGEWNPAPGFEFGLRIFKQYDGILSGILPKQLVNKLLIATGEYCGKVVMTKGASDYEVIYQQSNGREGRLIRVRHFSEPENIREEIIGIDYTATEKVESGEYLIGLSPQEAKQINVLV
jgi:hypothetical protein